MRPKSIFYDPIANARAQAERDEEFARLFHPIHSLPLMATPNWMVQDFLPTGYLTLLASEPKLGKTSFVTALALAVATGTPFAGQPTNQSPVLWVSGEENQAERSSLLVQSPLADPSTPLYTCHEFIAIDSDDGIDVLRYWLSQTNARLIVIDPLAACSQGRVLAVSSSARKTLMPLKTLCSQKNATAIVMHHASRRYQSDGHTVADNAQLAATASQTWLFDRRPSPLPSYQSMVHLRSRGRGAFANHAWTFGSNGPLDYNSLDPAPVEPMPESPPSHAEGRVIQALQRGPKTSEQIIDLVEGNPATLRNVITNLRRKGKVCVETSKNHTRKYRLAPELINKQMDVKT